MESATPTYTTDYAAFEPKAYLAEYYSTIPPENLYMVDFLVRAFRTVPNARRVLDFGGGPTLFSELIAAPHAEELHFGEYSAANRAEVKAWLAQSPGAFDWQHYTHQILVLQGEAPTADNIAMREALVRRRLTRVMPCNAILIPPIQQVAGGYDVVVTNLCLEAAARDLEEWYQCIRNLAMLLEPGGRFFLSGVQKASSYSVGHSVFPVISVNENDLRTALLDAGFAPESIQTEWTPADHPVHSYAGMIFAQATKMPARPRLPSRSARQLLRRERSHKTL
jgi:hypothetical protein